MGKGYKIEISFVLKRRNKGIGADFMTLIECFTGSHIDNIAACLRLHPDEMVMVGDVEEMRIPVKRYRQLLKQRGQNTKIRLCDVSRKNLAQTREVLEKLIRKQSDCVIDLTGGDEPVIMAVGAVLAELDCKKQSIRVEKLDHTTGYVIDCINGNRRIPYQATYLTVQELIMLHGGKLLGKSYQPPVDATYRDLAGLWSIVCEDPKEWNRAIMLLNEFESRSDSKMQVFLPLEYLRSSISEFDQKETVVRDLLQKLKNYGVIDDQSSPQALEYTYRSTMLRHCTQKAGNVLEVKTLLEGRAVRENGAPLFCDCQMGVSIDWDGVEHDPAEKKPETRNEIDVVLMHDLTPLFVSCKNGHIGEEELYKLHTVAERFGGPYARKMLIATDLDRKSSAADRAFVQRAWDMDIFLVTEAAKLSPEEWKQIFIQTMQ